MVLLASKMLLANTLSLEAQVSEEFVQILNVGQSHWITVSNVGCGPGRVKVFDSGGKYITHRNREETATILLTEENTITVEFMNVQHQFGVIDCGLFAIAFATEICDAIICVKHF